MKTRIDRQPPYVAPPDAPPLRDVVATLRSKTARLDEIDDTLSRYITTIERRLTALKFERVVSVKLPDGADLGWSRDRRTRTWRFVIRADDDVLHLRSCTREERCEVFTSGAMEKLMARAREEIRP